MRKQSQKGFSLIELMIAMVIIGLIASLIGPAMFGKVDSSKIKTAEAQMQLFATALDTYRLDVGVYPEKHSYFMGRNFTFSYPLLNKQRKLLCFVFFILITTNRVLFFG